MRSDRPRDAAARLLAGLERATVLVGMAERLPDALLAAVIAEARERRIELALLVADLSGRWAFVDDAALADVRAGRLRLCLVAGGVPPGLAGRVDQVVGSMWDVDRAIARRDLPVDVFLARVGVGRAGRATFGRMVGYGPSALGAADRIGLELVTESWPRYRDEVDFALADATAVIAGDGDDSATRRSGSAASPAQREVARRVAELVPDGATLQTGLGAIPAALFAELRGHRDLGAHSGILPAELGVLIAAGVVTGRRKSDECGRHVATGVLGDLAPAAGGAIRLEPISRTHDPVRLRAINALWAINSAFEIDLAGQVNAEFRHGLRVASGGGQTDFLRAGRLSSGGASVLALPARTPGGSPRIVPRLDPAHLPTTSAADLDWVVTDHGALDLRGLSAGERSDALIELAHPDDRAALRTSRSAPSIDVE